MENVIKKVIGFYDDVCEEKRELLLNKWMRPAESYTVNSILESLKQSQK
ncbi:hypothetical protein [Sinanaerobacter sp. ZZT-01]|nr:hypothetical protein [Sinanaerobacter sp. ZZT-01]WRR92801.1 hypothetical protein U5921_12275 [Sinanaerobacter sp. ZZT-01]